MSRLKKATLPVQGMHCPSCEFLIQDKFKEVSNVREVNANYRKQEAEVLYVGNLDKHALNKKIAAFGYQLGSKNEEYKEPYLKRFTDASAIAVFLFILYFFAQEFRILPDFNTSSGLTLMTAFILGLVASTSTCMATSGALFLSTVGKLSKSDLSFTQNIMPAISFNVGRVLSYGVFGFIAGFIGKTAAQNLQLGSFLTAFVAVFMILIGLSMLKLISFSFVAGNQFTKSVFAKIEGRLIQSPKKTAFLLGAITYLLPCGFTQSVQLYALGLANPVQSSLMMMVFAMGTSPALFAIGFASSFTKSSYYPYFSKIMGVLVFLIGLSYFSNFLSGYGITLNPFNQNNTYSYQSAVTKDGYQEVRMSVNAQGYNPQYFTVKQGVPVRWIVKGENVFGCQGFITAPKLGIQKALSMGENIFEFTPKEKGLIAFSCSMNMFRGMFNVI